MSLSILNTPHHLKTIAFTWHLNNYQSEFQLFDSFSNKTANVSNAIDKTDKKNREED